jgi:hypothetical protein
VRERERESARGGRGGGQGDQLSLSEALSSTRLLTNRENQNAGIALYG